ncbi:hypothetical protein ACFSTC_02035 [Nonomuraea ferruginea]
MGEICVSGESLMLGYWGEHEPDPEGTALVGGELRTGDVGCVGDDGYLYVVDRKKDLIIRGGFNVFPRDVEDVLNQHPGVVMSGVVGRPDDRLGEEVVAFVQLAGRRGGRRRGADRLGEGARGPRQVSPRGHVRRLDPGHQRAQTRPQGAAGAVRRLAGSATESGSCPIRDIS